MVRTRFAPSPTGKMHIGGVRTALFAWLFAHKNKGEFFLRIEDTDQQRFDPEGLEAIIESLKWIGINWDEGVIDKNGKEKGDFGPYIQSKRLDIYKKYTNELIEKGIAYYCFCSPERLEDLRKEQEKNKQAPMYDRACLKLSSEEAKKKIEDGQPFVIRFKMPDKKYILEDIVYGKIEFDGKLIDDPVLLKSDGYPTYHFAHIVDDYLMKTTHIVRGEEWIASAPKHLALFEAFGWEAPQYAHLPVILGSDKKKLSKRHGSTKVSDFQEQGYLPEAIINYIAFLGWNPKTEQEIFSKEELIENFDLSKVNKAAPIFSYEKLDWFNGQYIKKMDLEELAERCAPFIENQKTKACPELIRGIKNLPAGRQCQKFIEKISDKEYIKKIVSIERERIKKLSDITENIDFFLFDKIDYSAEKLIWKKSNKEETIKNLETIQDILSEIPENDWTKENLEAKITPKAEKAGKGNMLWPMRYALTGADKSPTPFEVAWVLGKDKSIERIGEGIQKLKILL
ncbi:MAG: glutamate--tRNA ligase [bacterium]